MFFVVLTFLTAFAIETIGTIVSVIGLSALFGSNPIIIALAIALDLGKIVVVSLLYTYWDKLGKLMKGYALIAAFITMSITSAGAGGYLTGEFQKAIMGTQETTVKVEALKAQQAKYEERKKQIDEQIASLPERTTVNQRLRLMNGFKAEQADLQAKISEIDKQLPELQIAQIGVEAKAGPIISIAKAFDVPVEQAVTWVIIAIIAVFDPLAVFLIIAGNFLLHQRRLHKDTAVDAGEVFAEPVTKAVELESSQSTLPKDRPMTFVPKERDNHFAPPEPMPPARQPGDDTGFLSFRQIPKAFEDYQRPVTQLPTPKPLVDSQNYPDASQAKVYTTDDIVEMNPKYASELDIIHHDEDEPPEVEAQPTIEDPVQQPIAPPREKITLSTLGIAPTSSLSNVKPDPYTITDSGQVPSRTRPSIYDKS